jgi:hypothetical protein
VVAVVGSGERRGQVLQEGWPVAIISRRLGHANPAITLAIYAHAITDMHGDEVFDARPLRLHGNGLTVAVPTTFSTSITKKSRHEAALRFCLQYKEESGTRGGARTHGLLLRRQTLYPLSYPRIDAMVAVLAVGVKAMNFDSRA